MFTITIIILSVFFISLFALVAKLESLPQNTQNLLHSKFSKFAKNTLTSKTKLKIVTLLGLYICLFTTLCFFTKNIFHILIAFTTSLLILPFVKIFRKRKRRRDFMKQFLPVLNQIANTVKSGCSIEESFMIVANENPAPISQEFSRILAQYKISHNLSASLDALCKRIPEKEVKLFANSVIIARHTGANIVEQLVNIRKTVSDRIYMEGKVKAMSAQGKVQGILSSFIPIIIFLSVNYFDPEYFKPLLKSPLGHLIIITATVSNIIGLFLITKLSKLKI